MGINAIYLRFVLLVAYILKSLFKQPDYNKNNS